MKKLTRRSMLSVGIIGVGSLGGCLRLQSGSGQTPNQNTIQQTAESSGTNPTESTSTPEDAPANITEDWPQLMRDSRNTGFAPEREGPADQVETVWTFETIMNFDASLSVSDGTAYGAAWGNTLFAIDVQTGEEQWRQTIGSNAPFGAPAIDSGTIVIGTHEGRVYGINSEGGYLWRLGTDAPVFSSQTIHENSVFVTTMGGTVYSVSLETGEIEWEISIDEPHSYSTPAVTNDTVIVAGSEFDTRPPENMFILSREFTEWAENNATGGRLYGLDRHSGDTKWSVSLDSPTIGSPTVSDGRAYIGTYDGTLTAIDLQRTSIDWQKQTDGAITAAPVVTKSMVYGSSWDRTLYAWNRETGNREWILPTKAPIKRSAIVVGNTVYLNGSDGWIYAVDAESGRMNWQYELDVGSDSIPAMANGMLLIGTKGKGNDDPNEPSPGKIYALA